MDFQIRSLNAEDFAHLFGLTDAELAAHNACRQVVTARPGTPCRVSLEDAEIGETVILCNYRHQPENSPYQASHAIFVRANAERAQLAVNQVPEAIRSRLISMRFFDRDHMMIGADAVQGDAVGEEIAAAFENSEIAYVHLHNAGPGCFAASAHRVG